MKCSECTSEMEPIIIPHYNGVWLWECPRCKIFYDLRIAKFFKY